ncbi:hypothetical protein K458DRAFT_384420 [Lentithecium fluviatile CBS 122367]|uniref:Uncharacterized protein n=1 Tax=Lentithecium fluviatile CBS 122367 TaxID=1168545 RepID=A0A6G1JI09_9PLEO|nr:hypothetical protein K458DRAFT_384420 [Lentithecium fluviatile CBS 122367]
MSSANARWCKTFGEVSNAIKAFNTKEALSFAELLKIGHDVPHVYEDSMELDYSTMKSFFSDLEEAGLRSNSKTIRDTFEMLDLVCLRRHGMQGVIQDLPCPFLNSRAVFEQIGCSPLLTIWNPACDVEGAGELAITLPTVYTARVLLMGRCFNIVYPPTPHNLKIAFEARLSHKRDPEGRPNLVGLCKKFEGGLYYLQEEGEMITVPAYSTFLSFTLTTSISVNCRAHLGTDFELFPPINTYHRVLRHRPEIERTAFARYRSENYIRCLEFMFSHPKNNQHQQLVDAWNRQDGWIALKGLCILAGIQSLDDQIFNMWGSYSAWKRQREGLPDFRKAPCGLCSMEFRSIGVAYVRDMKNHIRERHWNTELAKEKLGLD